MMKPTSNWPRVREYLLALILCTCFACSTADDWEARFVTEEVTISPISGTLHNSSRKLPDLRFQSQEEGSYLKFHRCHDEGEVYAAAYLVTKSHLLQHSITYDLKVANTELASFILLDTKHPKHEIRPGTMTQTLDILDFAVVHLSAYERLMRRYQKAEANSYGPLNVAVDRLSSFARMADRSPIYEKTGAASQLNRTVAIMPWLGSEVGVGNSHITHRQAFLKACFWSIYVAIPNIVIGVKTPKDYAYAKEASGLPFFSVIMMPNLPTSASLPLATLQETRSKIESGEWKFDYVYFTESDQLLMIKPQVAVDMFQFLDKYPRRVLVPHRLIPFPEEILKQNLRREGDVGFTTNTTVLAGHRNRDRRNLMALKPGKVEGKVGRVEVANDSEDSAHARQLANDVAGRSHVKRDAAKAAVGTPSSSVSSLASAAAAVSNALHLNSATSTDKAPSTPLRPLFEWMEMSCCLPRQNCVERNSWLHSSNKALPFLDIMGFQVALGNCNFHQETFRACKGLTPQRKDVCP